jgi:hypothetical protein
MLITPETNEHPAFPHSNLKDSHIVHPHLKAKIITPTKSKNGSLSKNMKITTSQSQQGTQTRAPSTRLQRQTLGQSNKKMPQDKAVITHHKIKPVDTAAGDNFLT